MSFDDIKVLNFKRKDGEIRLANVKYHISINNQNKKICFGWVNDITDTLKKSQILDLYTKYMNECIAIIDLKSRTNLYISDSIKNISGYPVDDFLGSSGFVNWKDKVVHPDFKDAVSNRMYSSKEIKYKIIDAGGAEVIIKSKRRRITYMGHECALVIFKDVTESTRKELHLEFDKLRQNNTIGLLAFNKKKDEILHVDESILKFVGISKREKFDFEKKLIQMGYPNDNFIYSDTEKINSFLGGEIDEIIVDASGKTDDYSVVEIKRKKIYFMNDECELIILNNITMQSINYNIFFLLRVYADQNCTEGIIIRSRLKNIYIYANAKLVEMSGHAKNIIKRTKSYYKLFAKEKIHKDDRERYIAAIEEGASLIRFRLLKNKKNIRYIELRRSTVKTKYDILGIGVFKDITEEVVDKKT